MNEAPNTNQTTGLGNTFSSQPAPQTNPFTADLKGEFTSDFGTNTGTNAVSQIFKEGGFSGPDKTKKIIAAVVVLVALVVVGIMVLGGGESEFDPAVPGETEGVAGEEGEEGMGEETAEEGEEAEAGDEEYAEEEGEEVVGEEGAEGEETGEYSEEGETMAEGEGTEAVESTAGTSSYSSAGKSSGAGYGYGYSSGASSMGSGPISLTEPADGSTLGYDETQGPAMFSWSGGGGYITFSRNQSMNPVTMRVRASGNSYKFHHPWPGTWYWKVENASGSTEVRSFQVQAPVRRNIVMSEPAAGGAVSGNGGTVSWQGDNNVAFYRVEFSASGSWANPEFRFATSGNSVSLQGVSPGQYQMRVGAFSEVSGRWEYTAAAPVSVQ